MRKKLILGVVSASLLAIVALQAVWYESAYSLNRKTLERQLDDVFMKAVEEEIRMRFRLTPDTFRVGAPEDLGELERLAAYNAQITRMGFPISVAALDSIAASLMRNTESGMECLVIHRLGTQENHNGQDTHGWLWRHEDRLRSCRLPTAADGKAYVQLVATDPDRHLKARMEGTLLLTAVIMCAAAAGLLLQLRLFLSEKELRRREETFMQAVVHNMKQPVSVATACMETLSHPHIDRVPKLKESAVHRLQGSIRSLVSLTRQSLVVFDMEQGMKLRFEPVELERVVQEWTELYRTEGGKEIRFHTALHTAEVYAERQMLKEVLGNLIGNSVKYSGERVEIGIRSESDARHDIIRVSDNGWGISRKDCRRIFRKYERINPARGKAPGFGIGLRYVADVMRMHGGRVTVQSVVGQGTEFALWFPKRAR